MPEGRRPRGPTPCLRSGVAAESARLLQSMSEVGGGGQEELPLHPRSGVAARRRYPPPEARVGSWEEQAHIQGVVAAWAQEGLEELLHVQGQEKQR